MAYKWCVVPQCMSTSIKNPQKLFVSVPTHRSKRKMWLQLAQRDPNSIQPNSNVFMCEDHFNMEHDVKNYMQFKMGFSKKILLTDEAVPSKFDCQNPLKRRERPNTSCSRKVSLKRKRTGHTGLLRRQNCTESSPKDDVVQAILPVDSSNVFEDPLSLKPRAQCRICAELVEDYIYITEDKPYLTRNKTLLTLNDLNIELDFNNASKTVCSACDIKLLAMFDFVKQVKEAQLMMHDIVIEVDNIKMERESPAPDSSEEILIETADGVDSDDIVDSFTAPEIIIQPFKPKREKVSVPKLKVMERLENEEGIIEMKEEMATDDETDEYEVEYLETSDNETDNKSTEFGTLLKLMK